MSIVINEHLDLLDMTFLLRVSTECVSRRLKENILVTALWRTPRQGAHDGCRNHKSTHNLSLHISIIFWRIEYPICAPADTSETPLICFPLICFPLICFLPCKITTLVASSRQTMISMLRVTRFYLIILTAQRLVRDCRCELCYVRYKLANNFWQLTARQLCQASHRISYQKNAALNDLHIDIALQYTI